MRSSSSPSLRCISSSACVKRATSGSVGFCPALLSVLPISRRTTTCAHATTQTTNAVPMAQLGIIHTLHPLRSEEHTSELQSHHDLVCRLLLEKKKKKRNETTTSKTKRP